MSRGKTLSGQAREMVVKVSKYFENENQNGGPVESLAQVHLRTANALGISTRTVSRILREKYGPSGMEENELRTPAITRKRSATDIGALDVEAIRNHVNAYYDTEENPTLKKLLASLKNANLYKGCGVSLLSVFKKIGIDYKKPKEIGVNHKKEKKLDQKYIKMVDIESIVGAAKKQSTSKQSLGQASEHVHPLNISKDYDQSSELLPAEFAELDYKLEGASSCAQGALLLRSNQNNPIADDLEIQNEHSSEEQLELIKIDPIYDDAIEF